MENKKKETIGLLVTMKAKVGKAQDVKDFLFSGLPLVLEEPETISWFAFQIDDNTFGIYDTFEVEAGRKAHLKGQAAKALITHADNLLENFDANVNIEFVNVIASNHKHGTQNKGLLVMMNAKTGKSEALEQFLKTGKQLVTDEPETLSWYALKLDDTTYAIFDTFTENSGRDAHLSGKVAAALLENAPVLLNDFKTTAIQNIDILAYK
ncbi:hypothetical protein Q4Q39_15990 [Flavivirga amylovorans]|uniref:Antibiotic biosynthesis monooxygenase n=1 Tax=Flavivirga amylovorans TaxID=870486 RepID=A0ABT8X4V3_9FLAO|nr:hypothetical protein [Flavivirga amylovorans]MDO5988911.1 hypothetical protein [Flavivirga amylovorans]